MCSDKTLNYDGATLSHECASKSYKKINKMNIYITHNLGYNPFQIYNHRQKRCKTIKAIFKKLQLSGKTSNFVQYGSKM